MKKVIVLSMVLAAALVIAGCEGSKGAVAAKVNNKNITVADIDNEIAALPAQYKMFAQSPDMKKRILENLVLTEVIFQYAEQSGIAGDKEIQAKIKENEKNLLAEIESQMVELKKQKENVSKNAKREILIGEVFGKKEYEKLEVSEADLKEAYDNYASQMKSSNPGAKVQSYASLKNDIKPAVQRDKWLKQLKEKANVRVFESVLGSAPAPQQQINIKPQGE